MGILMAQAVHGSYSYRNNPSRFEVQFSTANSKQKKAQKELNSALRDAAKEGNIDVMERLLLVGVDKDGADSDGHTALHLAVYYSQFPAVRFLVEEGADVNTVNKARVSPLHTAYQKQFWASRNMQVNTVHATYQKQCDDIVEFLLKKGADTTVVDAWGNTPEMYKAQPKKKKSLLSSFKAFMG